MDESLTHHAEEDAEAISSHKVVPQAEKRLHIDVEDTGIGISSSEISKLFKYFGKLNDPHNLNKKGTGLGLNISKKIVNSMGGQISVQS